MKIEKIFKAMFELPRMGIFVLRNDKKKRVYISYSKQLLTSLCRNIREMQDKVHVYKPLNYNFKDWKFSIIETLTFNDTILDISCKVGSLVQVYKQLGYDVRTHKNIAQLRFRVDVGQDYKIYCKLITKNYNEYVMGVFETMQDAEEFIQQYRNMSIISPLYASNTLTREYFERRSR